MKTTKPFACITYNSNKFLTKKLNELVTNHVISFYAYINHKGEMEVNLSTGEMVQDKDHTHLYIVPNRSVDTMDLMDTLLEVDKKHPNKPLKPLAFAPSKFDDWYLYALHDEDYLATKFETKQFHYDNSAFHVSNDMEFDWMTFQVFHTSEYTKQRRLVEYLRKGGTMSSLAKRGAISPHQAFSYTMFEKLWNGNQKEDIDN